LRTPHRPVTVVTDRNFHMGETSIVNMVQRASKKVLLEPGDTRQQWKGEAATSFVCAGITSSRMLPTSSVDYWSPFIILFCYFITGASEETLSFGGVFLPPRAKPKSPCRIGRSDALYPHERRAGIMKLLAAHKGAKRVQGLAKLHSCVGQERDPRD
jgi:hypothetical protein